MQRRAYLGIAGAGIVGSVAGCLADAAESPRRPFGETQHRNNIAMAPTSIETKATLTARDGTISPDAGKFALVRFWAENLVDSRRHLPVVGEMKLHTESPAASYEPRMLASWSGQYRGGTVEPGVIRAGRVVFDVPAETANQAEFSIQPQQSEFSEPIRWVSE